MGSDSAPSAPVLGGCSKGARPGLLVALCLQGALSKERADPQTKPKDLLGNIHSGLLGHELSVVLQAAREVGAAVVPVDRPGKAIRSRVGQLLWHPRLGASQPQVAVVVRMG